MLPQIFGRWFLALVLYIKTFFLCVVLIVLPLYGVKTSMTFLVIATVTGCVLSKSRSQTMFT